MSEHGPGVAGTGVPEGALRVAAADVDISPVHAVMRAALQPPEPRLAPAYDWLRYHLGWAELDGTAVDVRTAKGIRPRLCILAARAVRGRPEAVHHAAAAIELTHEFSLIHDDIQDRDRTRRGRPTLWTVVGIAQAINAGDLMWAIARSTLLDGPQGSDALLGLAWRYDAACRRLAHGQFLDIAFAERPVDAVSVDDYLTMVGGKTCALLGLATALGALGGGAEGETVGALERFGTELGIAFQMQDDVLGLWGDPDRTGKPVGNDLIRGKRSLPTLLALAHPTLGPEVRSALEQGVDRDGAQGLADRMADAGVKDDAVRHARSHGQRAMSALEGYPLDGQVLGTLAALAEAAVARVR